LERLDTIDGRTEADFIWRSNLKVNDDQLYVSTAVHQYAIMKLGSFGIDDRECHTRRSCHRACSY
jgi:hypothetical protein